MKTILFSFIFCLVHVCLTAQPGTLDSSFNKDGKIISKTYTGQCFTSLIQTDGKIVIGGGGSYYRGNDLISGTFLARYNTDGNLDYSFADSGRGVYWFDSPSVYKPFIHDIVLQPDKKIVAIGEVATYGSFGVMRFNSDGSIDKSFGNEGISETQISGGLDAAEAVALLGDGRIVVSGNLDVFGDHGGSQSFIACYTKEGKLDRSFGDTGIAIYTAAALIHISSIAVTAKNKIMIGGAFGANSRANNIVLCYNANGTPDLSFGVNGLAEIFFDEQFNGVSANAIAIDKNGKIIVGGDVGFSSGTISINVSRFSENGKPDSSFGTKGYSYIENYKGNSYGISVAVQQNGKIIIGGYHSTRDSASFMVVRCNNDGTLDSTFGEKGIQNTYILASDLAYSVNLQKDGKIVLAGYSLIYHGTDQRYSVELTRYNGDSTKRQIIINKIKHYISTHNNANAEALNNNITLYPNPVQNILTIKGLSAINNYELLIMNDKGSVLATKQVSNIASYQFHVQNLSSGVYYVNVVANNKLISTLKFVKQ